MHPLLKNILQASLNFLNLIYKIFKPVFRIIKPVYLLQLTTLVLPFLLCEMPNFEFLLDMPASFYLGINAFSLSLIIFSLIDFVSLKKLFSLLLINSAIIIYAGGYFYEDIFALGVNNIYLIYSIVVAILIAGFFGNLLRYIVSRLNKLKNPELVQHTLAWDFILIILSACSVYLIIPYTSSTEYWWVVVPFISFSLYFLIHVQFKNFKKLITYFKSLLNFFKKTLAYFKSSPTITLSFNIIDRKEQQRLNLIRALEQEKFIRKLSIQAAKEKLNEEKIKLLVEKELQKNAGKNLIGKIRFSCFILLEFLPNILKQLITSKNFFIIYTFIS